MILLPSEPMRLLLVEDNGADRRLFQENLKALPFPLPIRLDIVTDGEEALAFLRQQPPYADVPRPHCIFLDLYLPRKTGFEVLGTGAGFHLDHDSGGRVSRVEPAEGGTGDLSVASGLFFSERV